MSHLVVDASVAVKWVVKEDDSELALGILRSGRLLAPDLMIAECATILWKKVARGELRREEAQLAADLLRRSPVEVLPTRHLIGDATALAIELNHPAYDCLYLAFAIDRDCQFVTADNRLLRRLEQGSLRELRSRVSSLAEASNLT